MMDIITQLYGLISTSFKNLGQQNGRRALIYLLGNNSNAIIAADILIYLIFQTYTTSPDILERYDGFIARPYQQIEMDTGCSNLRKHKTPINLLIEEGLIETHHNSSKNTTCYKVNLDTLITKLDEAYVALGKEMAEFYKEFGNKLRERKEEKSIPHKDIDWTMMNEYLAEGPDGVPVGYEFLIEKGFKSFDIEMMFYIRELWQEYYGTDYEWSEAEFNTLSSYITSKGVTKVDRERLKEAVRTFNENSFMKGAHTAMRLQLRYNNPGLRNFK